ncbi:MAG: CvpA family protein [Pirellulales bacterium]|nr:CvpA family protein [Pirellulales bacterium]
MQTYDVFMLSVIILTALFGAWKGMAWQLASLASVLVSFMVAAQFSGALAPHLSDQEPWNRFVAMLLLFAATSAAIWLLFRVVAGLIDRVKLREFDRQMGAIFGLAKGVLLCVVITFFAVTLSETARQTILPTRSGYYIALLIQRATPVMPEEIRNVLGKYIDELDRKLDPTTPPDPLPEFPLNAGRGQPLGCALPPAENAWKMPVEGRMPAEPPSGFSGDFWVSDRT